MKAAEIERLRSLVSSLLISYHDFKATRNLDSTLQRMAAFAPDFYKLVTTATSLHDNIVMLNFLQKYRDDYALIGLCMGETGIMSRVLGMRAGAVFTFASPLVGEPTAIRAGLRPRIAGCIPNRATRRCDAGLWRRPAIPCGIRSRRS